MEGMGNEKVKAFYSTCVDLAKKYGADASIAAEEMLEVVEVEKQLYMHGVDVTFYYNFTNSIFHSLFSVLQSRKWVKQCVFLYKVEKCHYSK